MSSIPANATVKSAKLSLYCYAHGTKLHTGGNPNNAAKAIYRMTGNWSESSITWNNKPQFNSSAIAQNSNTSTNRWEDFTVTEAVKDMVANGNTNYGFLIKFPSETSYKGARFRSSEYSTTSNRPKLVVTYETGDQQAPTVTVTAPTAGEILQGGESYTIKWNAQDNVGVTARAIYFISTSSSIEPLIDSSSGNSGTFVWTVPKESITDCKILVKAYDAAGNMGQDESGAFSISSVGIITNRFNLPFAKEYSVTILNAQGRIISTAHKVNLQAIDHLLNNVPNGIHYVKIETPKTGIIKRVVNIQ